MTDARFLFNGPATSTTLLVLAHGAGGPMDSPFMARMAGGLGARGIRVVRFEFPYMAARRFGGGSKAPDKEPVVRKSWADTVESLAGEHAGKTLFIGGKSFGGRMASLVADELGVDGLVCLGYPFHPPGKPETLRTKHLASLSTPALVVQGSRDAFGSREEIEGYALAKTIRVVFLEGGDHSWKPPAKSGRTEAQNVDEGIEAVADFVLPG